MIALTLAALHAGLSAASAEEPAPAPACDPQHAAAVKAAYDEGESERQDRTADATSVLKRDEERVELMRKYDKKGWLCTPESKWQAAWIMVQADDVDTLERAYQLAIESMQERHPRGPWLVAFTFDRKRVAGGYRQSYGTQTRDDGRGHRCLIEVESDVTDEERAKYQQPPLADVYRKILDLNGFPDDPATADRMQRRGLSCPPAAQTRKAQRTVAPPPE